jgi:mannosyltransferase OCH1-like enzyme
MEIMIPKIIHCCWFSGDEKPDNIKKWISTWREVMPDYQIKEWSMADVAEIRKEYKFMDQALVAKKWAFAADVLRLWILYHEGGIYLDMDVEVLKSFDPFLHHGFFTCYEHAKHIEAAVLGAVKGHEFIGEALEVYKNKEFINENGKPNMRFIVPKVMTDIFLKKYRKFHPVKRKVIINDLCIYPFYYFSPKDNIKKKIHIKQDTYAIHYFTNSYLTPSKPNWKSHVIYCLNRMLSYKTFNRVLSFLYKLDDKKKQKKAKKQQKKISKHSTQHFRTD